MKLKRNTIVDRIKKVGGNVLYAAYPGDLPDDWESDSTFNAWITGLSNNVPPHTTIIPISVPDKETA